MENQHEMLKRVLDDQARRVAEGMGAQRRAHERTIVALLVAIIALILLVFLQGMAIKDAWGQELPDLLNDGVLEGAVFEMPRFTLDPPRSSPVDWFDKGPLEGAVRLEGGNPLDPEILFTSHLVPVEVYPFTQNGPGTNRMGPRSDFMDSSLFGDVQTPSGRGGLSDE